MKMNFFSRINKYLWPRNNATRGYGMLEYFLAIQRARIANRFIRELHKNGKILDIGYGSYPIFLLTAKFAEKFGIEERECPKPGLARRLNFINHDLEKGGTLPFEDASIDTVTMLAVLEHLDPNIGSILTPDIYRILKPGGILIITVPATWSGWVLKVLSYPGFISKIELDDHETIPRSSEIKSMLKKAAFSDIKTGYFEFFMNRYFVAKK